jgi:hypothetical protein
MHVSTIRFEVTKAEQVEAQDIIDAARTLTPVSKIVVEIPHPGKGPDHFLQWAREELAEAETSTIPSQAARKAFNVSILSKCAFECLVDWYLSKHLLNLTIRQFAGLAEKLEALNAEARLGIGLSLFQNTIFDPRNNAVHKYELVDLAEARRSYELAHLAIRNCRNTEAPHLSPIFYGDLEIYTGIEAFRFAYSNQRIVDIPKSPTGADATAFCFAGIGETGKCAAFIDRSPTGWVLAAFTNFNPQPDSTISIFTSLGNGEVESRYSPIKKFTSEQLREVFHLLESSNPRPIALPADDLDSVLQAMRKR